MKFTNPLARLLGSSAAALALVVFVAFAAAHAATPHQEKDKNQPPASKGEVELGEKINKAPDAATKLTLAEEFVKKYPKSAYRPQLAEYVGGEVISVADAAQKLTLTEKYVTVFDGPGEADRMNTALLELYIAAGRLDDAYRVGGAWLAKHPEEVTVRTRLALLGIIEAQKKNPKFVTQSVEYARQAAALMEADKQPATSDAAQWAQFKTQWLPQLYQALGVVAYASKNTAEARTHLDKAIALNIPDPTTYFIVADMADVEYVEMATKYKSMSPGAEQDALLKRATEKLDQTIELYARAVAFTEGKPEHQGLRTHIMEALTAYYKYRNNGSDAGLQQLIDKHKPAAKP